MQMIRPGPRAETMMGWLKIPDFLKGKIWRILLFFVLGWIATGFYIYFHYEQLFAGSKSFWQDAFTAWCGELAFFTVVGLAATIISIERPEDPHARAFEERLKILFGNQLPQTVLEHNRKTLQSNARYSTNGSRKIYIKEYNAEIDAYYVRSENHYFMKSAIADFDWTEEIIMKIEPDELPRLQSGRVGMITSFKINGAEKIRGPKPITKEKLELKFKETSPAGRAVEVVTEHEIYMACDCEQSQTAMRFAESLSVRFINQWDEGVKISFADRPGTLEPLGFNEEYQVKRAGVEPGDLIVNFKLHAPRGKPGQAIPENAGTEAAHLLQANLHSSSGAG